MTHSALVDLLPARRHDVPLGSERLRALPFRLPGLVVVVVVVKRMPTVRRLQRPVRALDRPDLRGGDARAGGRLAGGDERRPDLRAARVAGALSLLVLLEQVERQ